MPYTIATIAHILACFFLVIVVLLQTGKGADAGAVFGGSSQTIFGSQGAGNFLTKTTTGIAILFMLTSLFLSYGAARKTTESLFDAAPVESSTLQEEPVTDAPGAGTESGTSDQSATHQPETTGITATVEPETTAPAATEPSAESSQAAVPTVSEAPSASEPAPSTASEPATETTDAAAVADPLSQAEPLSSE